MKKLPIKFIQFLCIMAMVFLGGPFFRIPTGEIMQNGYMPADKHSGSGFIWETVEAYFTGSHTVNKTLVIIAFTVGVITLMQFIAGLVKRTKLIIATSVIMTMILVAGLLYIWNYNLDVTVRRGYYLYLAAQFVLAIGTPITIKKTKP